MSLPTLNTTKHTMTLVSSGETITFRPFTVGEEKSLLTVTENASMDNIYPILRDVILACTFNKVDIADVPLFDVEYIFLQLRAKSVGEIIPLKFKCKHTGKTINTQIDISVIKPEGSTTLKDISITDDIKIKMKYPTLSSVKTIDTDDFVEVICSCIDTVYSNDDVYSIDSKKELADWVSTMNKTQVSSILEFFNAIPKLQHDVVYTVDDKEYSLHIEGLNDFFTLG